MGKLGLGQKIKFLTFFCGARWGHYQKRGFFFLVFPGGGGQKKKPPGLNAPPFFFLFFYPISLMSKAKKKITRGMDPPTPGGNLPLFQKKRLLAPKFKFGFFFFNQGKKGFFGKNF